MSKVFLNFRVWEECGLKSHFENRVQNHEAVGLLIHYMEAEELSLSILRKWQNKKQEVVPHEY